MHYLYRTYDKKGKPLYFGVSYNFFQRLDTHHNKEWWKKVYKIEIDRFDSRYLALEGERIEPDVSVPTAAAA